MSLDLNKLQNVCQRGSKLIAACPACREAGADNAGQHLAIYPEGSFACILHPGPAGDIHRKRIFELAGIQGIATALLAKPALLKSKARLMLPSLRKLTVTEMGQIAAFRQWPLMAGMELLSQRGLLWQGMVFDAGRDWPAWIITDGTQRNAQARRLDGQPWEGIRGAKAKTIFHAEASWPIGAPEIGERPLVLLCEGGPDFLASLFVAWCEGFGIPGFDIERVAPVCICGAGHSIPAEALPYFAGKHVRISIHGDSEGKAAAERWAAQLYGAGARSVDGFDFAGMTRPGGKPVRDLADFAQALDPENLPGIRALADLPDWIFPLTQVPGIAV